MCVLFYGGQLAQGLETINPWKLPRSNLGSEMRSLDQIFSLCDAVPDTRGLLISDHATTVGAESSKWLPKNNLRNKE